MTVAPSRGFHLPSVTLAIAAACLAACAGPAAAPPPSPRAAPSAGAAAAEPATRRDYGAEPPAALTPAEARAADLLRARQGSSAQLSGALTIAARLLARRAASQGDDALERTAVRDALAEAAAWDPAPSAFLARSSPARVADALARSAEGQRASAIGVGVAEDGKGGAVAVVLCADRRLRLDRFPRDVKVGSSLVLAGELQGGMRRPRLFVTLPSGQVQAPAVSGDAAFRAPIAFRERGRYVVEVIGEAVDGPSVAALLVVSAGGASLASPPEPVAADPADPAQAEAQVLSELNALRSRRGLAPVVSSPELAAVARRHSGAMLAAGKVAHIVPGSPGPGERLSQARIAYQRVYENVAAAGTALGAHRAAAESPAHLQNMLQPDVAQVGVGIARKPLASGGSRVYLTQILAVPPEDGAESRLTPEGRVREALWTERARLALPPLTADAALDELARQGAQELRRRDARELPDLAARALELGRSLAASDGFVAGAPRDAARSRNLPDARFRRVGVGVVEGPSRRYGPGRLFIAVVYTD